MPTLNIADHILFALLAFVLPLVVIWRGRSGELRIPQDSGLKIRIYWMNSLILWLGALTVIALWLISGRTLESLGVIWPVRGSFPHWMLIVATFGLLYLIDAIISWNISEPHPAAGILPTNWKEFRHFGTIVSLSAAICEEVIFRGFFITYLLIFLDGAPYAAWIAIGGSSLAFGVAHMYQGGAALLKITMLSVLFAVLFVMTGSLVVVVVLHFAVDFISGLLAMIKYKADKGYARRIAHP